MLKYECRGPCGLGGFSVLVMLLSYPDIGTIVSSIGSKKEHCVVIILA